MKIFGAGLAGLLAACHFQDAEVYEAGSPHANVHKALLRFRSSAVGDSVGIEFKPVTVRKAIWANGNFVDPSPSWSNLYSYKVSGKILDRSIWNLDTCTRYIAPEDFIEQLVSRVGNRINWNTKVGLEMSNGDEPCISTIPMHVWAQSSGEGSIPEFKFSNINVKRYRVKGAEVYQTVYFPSFGNNVYRASITGDLLIVESIEEQTSYDIDCVLKSFGLLTYLVQEIESVSQKYGKIAPIPDQWRRNFIYKMTKEHKIFSLGRFATWRNILLDDVLNDISVIKRLVSCSDYELIKRR